ncbi:MAG: hypothetical protein LHW64_05935 [Candidatus Cloacimonetes bacterium]|jgi:Tfp pilus assembly protein PilN/TolA-binding protein|nr:hypothetical protein [Candidatus Cloacimonadota bacterium]MCB5287323.1 hypothetical protein [Candidatus Cloacimonadota bacterium]MCK9184073.1 hypothetical protein [Candidatus Cloacimonadota bacterium]MCK9584102.1 hypothetical protein [Candidatus Cloacimonadota bacterium]MDY0229645.1 hypothetical protein [Candidatus Cloacimonadaceae bacterium]
MKKAPREAFGIYQDGQIVRMVHLRKEGTETYLLGVDSISLDKDWYKGDQGQTSVAESGFISMEESYLDTGDLDLDMNMSMDDAGGEISLNSATGLSSTRMEVSPTTMMYAKFPLHQGVIALNVHEEHIQKDKPGLTSKKALNAFRKSLLSKSQIKAGHWHSCVVKSEGEDKHWLHTGPNLLLDSLQSYAKESNTKLFYQLADANDLALTEYYQFAEASENPGISLFTYLGREYRKIFVFQDGAWIRTLPIHINQEYPEQDVIFSKIALALDSAQVGEVESIVLAGDLANQQLVHYINSQNVSMNAKLLSFPYLLVGHTQAGENKEDEDQALNPYALALALAYKALNMDNPVFGKCNFLPSRVLDNQKELKVVWHGFIVLSLIFGLVLYTTSSFLDKQQKLHQSQQENAELTLVLNQLKAENAIIETLTAEISLYKQGAEKLINLLKGKNPWTETFDRINTVFASYPKSWITNMRQAEGRIAISGITARREHVSRLAEGLPDGCIRRVTPSKIKNQTVWNFEIDFLSPEINWEDVIASETVIKADREATTQTNKAETAAPRAKSAATTSPKASATTKPAAKTETKAPRTKSEPNTAYQKPPAKPAQPKKKIQSETYSFGPLPEIPPANAPSPEAEELAQNEEFARTFQSFMEAIHRGDMLEYRFIGYALINKYPESSLLPLTRWWLAYRLYQEKEYTLAEEYLSPNLSQFGRFHPDSLLLKARLSYARSKPDFIQYYQSLQSEYPRSKAAAQAVLDLEQIQRGKR